MINLVDIGGESCEPVAGISTVLYAKHSAIKIWGEPAELCSDTTTSFAELVSIAVAGHEFNEEQFAHKIKFITETGTVKSTMIGEKRRRLFENELVCEVSGSGPELLGFLRWIKNQDLVFFVEEFGSGNIRQLGSSRLPAWVEGLEHAIEGTIEGKNSVTITIKDKQKYPAPIYKGVLPLEPITP